MNPPTENASSPLFLFKPNLHISIINGSELLSHEPSFPLSQDLSKVTVSVQLTGLSVRRKSPNNKTTTNDNGLTTTTGEYSHKCTHVTYTHKDKMNLKSEKLHSDRKENNLKKFRNITHRYEFVFIIVLLVIYYSAMLSQT